MSRRQMFLLYALVGFCAAGVVAAAVWLFFGATVQDCTTYSRSGEVVANVCDPLNWTTVVLSSLGLVLAILALAGSIVAVVLVRRQSAARA